MAVVLAIKNFRMYIDVHSFKVVTDHSSLRWLMNQSDLSDRLARWAIKLQGYSFETEHRKGCENVVTDALFHAFEDVGVPGLNVEVHPEIDLTSDAFQSEEYFALRNQFSSPQLPDFQVVDDFIYHRAAFSNSIDTSPHDCWKLFLPESLRRSVISAAHD